MIIGITGPSGSGKGTVVSFLQEKYNFIHFSVSDFLKEKIKERGYLSGRDSLIKIANELRKKYGGDYIVKKLYQKAIKSPKDIVIESIRSPIEAEFLKSKKNSFLLSVTADIKTRYDKKRKGKKDNVSFQKFLEQEEMEMSSKDPNKQNIRKCMELSDYKIDNNKSIANLKKQIKEVIKKIEKKKD